MSETRLKQNDITLKQLVQLSLQAYRTSQIDDKTKRAKLDIIGGRITFRRGLKYNQSEKKWEQDSREVRIDFLVKTEPISYKKTDTIKIHKYPITFLFRNFEKGFDSPIRIRVGSNKKPRFPKKNIRDAGLISEAKTEKEKEKIRKAQDVIRQQNQIVTDYNIKSGIQMQFFFDSMWVYKVNGILFGPNYTNRPPSERNPKGLLFMSKHEWYIVTKILPTIFNNPKMKQFFKND